MPKKVNREQVTDIALVVCYVWRESEKVKKKKSIKSYEFLFLTTSGATYNFKFARNNSYQSFICLTTMSSFIISLCPMVCDED